MAQARHPIHGFLTGISLLALAGVLQVGGSAGAVASGPLAEVGYPVLAIPHARPIASNGRLVYVVANTPADTVDVFDAPTRALQPQNSGGH